MDRFIAVQGMHLAAPESHAVLLGFAFVAALAVGLLTTAGLRRIAPVLSLSEAPRPRSNRVVAKVGGIGIFLTIALVGPALWLVSGEWSLHVPERAPVLAVLGGAIAMVALGIWDDRDELRPRVKLAFQVLAAAAVWWAGARFQGFAVPGGHIELWAPTSLLVTVFWFVALTNAFNLVDGADGVAGGAALTATMAMFVVSVFLGQTLVAYVLAVVAGAVVGFLFFNFPPASVYLGDAGSLSLGFLLAGVGLVTSSKAATLLAVAIPVVSLGLPLLDTGLAIVRRLIRGDSIAARDLGHIHHRLTKLGHSPRKVALLLFGVSAMLALASLLLLTPNLRLVGISYSVLGIVAFIGLQRLHVPELLELQRAIARGLRRSSNIAQNVALREALDAMAHMENDSEALEELGRAFQRTDFLEAEIRLLGDSTERGTDRVIWSWKREADGNGQAAGLHEVIDLAAARDSRDGRGRRRDGVEHHNGRGRRNGREGRDGHERRNGRERRHDGQAWSAVDGNGAHGNGAHGNGAHGNGAHGNGARGTGAHGTGAHGGNEGRRALDGDRFEDGSRPARAEDVHWEARLPLIDQATGEVEGWLTIRRPWGTYLPSELDVLARELLPGALGVGVNGNGANVAADDRGTRARGASSRPVSGLGSGATEAGA